MCKSHKSYQYIIALAAAASAADVVVDADVVNYQHYLQH
jgi:hypothetical protein